MKITEEILILNKTPSSNFKSILEEVRASIQKVVWPPNSNKFTIYPESGKKRGEGNGVKPIKLECIRYLSKKGWVPEKLPENIKGIVGIGSFDAYLSRKGVSAALEWETGNISSSHRAINKLCLLMIHDYLDFGFFIIPSDKLKNYLTDRIGNIEELRPYFDVWKTLRLLNKEIAVIVIEHDSISKDVPKIPKGKDGNAFIHQ